MFQCQILTGRRWETARQVHRLFGCVEFVVFDPPYCEVRSVPAERSG